MKKIFPFILIAYLVLRTSIIIGQTYSPVQGATGVELSPTLTITFGATEIINLGNQKNIYVAKSDWSSYITMPTGTPPPTDSRLDATGNILTIDLSGELLEENTEYLVFTDNDALLLDGSPWNNLTDDTFWRFTTLTSPPSITTYDPIQGATDVSIDKIFNLTFSENIAFNTSGTYFIDVFEDGVGAPIHSFTITNGSPSAGASIANDILTLDIPVSMNNNAVHYILVDNGAIVSSVSSAPFGGISDVNQWRFTTTAKLPEILTYDPIQDATDVPVDQTLTLSFDENIVFNTSGTATYIDIFEDGNPTPVYSFYARYSTGYNGLSISGSDLIINPATNLNSNTTYYVLMDNDVVRSQSSGLSFPGFPDVNQWRFTTETVAPSITTYDPIQGATDVSIDKIFNLTFSENIAFNTSGTYFIDVFEDGVGAPIHSFTITNGSPSAGASIANDILTLDIPVSMNNNAVHYILVDNGAIVSSVSSAPFGGISDVNQWRFTTTAKLPEILTYDPIQDATDVPVDQTLTLSFDENIVFNPSGTATYIDIFEDGNPTPVYSFYARYSTGYNGLSISGSDLIINPATDLNSNTTYYVLMDNDVIRSQSSGLSFPGFSDVNQWRFATETVAPSITTYDPIQGATDVSIDKIFTLTFSENIAFNTSGTYFIDVFEDGVGAPIHSFTITNGSPSAGASIANDILTLDIPVSMNNNAVHYILVDNGAIVSSVSSAPFGGISDVNQWRFTTTAKLPEILTYDPIQDATDVPVDQTLTLSFDENIVFNPSGTATYIDIFEDGNPTPVYSFYARYSNGYNGLSISGSDLIINPATDLNSNTTYYVLMDNDVIRSQSSGLSFPGFSDVNQWRFATETVAPSITTYDPIQGATDVSIDKIFTLTFSENIAFNTSGTYFIDVFEDGVGAPIHSFTITNGSPSAGASIANDILTLDIPVSMNNNAVHYILVDNGAIVSSVSSAPFGGISDVNQWRFTTTAKLPEILTYDPIQDATDVPVDQTLTLSFDENIVFNPSGTATYIDIFEDGNPTPVYSFYARYSTGYNGLSISGSDLIINPATDLNSNTTYYVLMDNDVVRSQSSGLSFPGFSDVNLWRFTTADIAPITTITPANGSTSISVKTQITIDFDQYVQLIGGTEIDGGNVRSIITFTEGIGGPTVAYSATINAGKDKIIITPDSDLLSETSYYIEIAAVQNIGGTAQSSSSSSTFTTDKFRYWTGALSSDITNNGNWNEALPFGNFSAVIQESASNMPILGISAEFNSLIIDAGASFSITSSGSLTINDLLELNSSNTQSIGNAALLNEGTLNMKIGAETKIHQIISSEPYDYFISSPVTNATPASVGVNGNAYKFVPDTKWVTMGPTEVFNNAEGYSVWSTSGTDLVFSGSINNANSYDFSCERVTSPYNNYGWNLMGNPYPCSIDWDALNLSAEIYDHFYMRITDTGQYGVYNGSGDVNLDPVNPGYIPSMHAVWVQVDINETTGNVNIPNTARRAANYTYLKTSKSGVPALKLSGVNKSGQKDETLIAFNPDVYTGDSQYNSEKRFMSNNTNMLELYSVRSMEQLAINSYSDDVTDLAVELGYNAGADGTYFIEFTYMKNFASVMDVKLEDTKNKRITPIFPSDKYEFTTVKGTNETRFILHISEGIANNINVGEKYNVKTYNLNNDIYIEVPHLTDPRVEFYNLSGKILYNENLAPSALNKINLQQKGMILVKVIAKEGVFTNKLLIK